MSDEIFNKIRAELSLFDDPHVKVTADRQLSTLPIDSLTEIVLMASLEDHFDITISIGEQKSLETIGDLVRLVGEKVNARPIAA